MLNRVCQMLSTIPGLFPPVRSRSYGSGCWGAGGDEETMESPSMDGPTSETGLDGSEDMTESRTASILESAMDEAEFDPRNDFLSSSMSFSSSRMSKSLDSNRGSPLA